MKASAYGLTVNPDEHWSHDAACANTNPDMWHIASMHPNWQQVGRAIHICRRHCPVRKECFREMQGFKSSIIGGYYFNDSGKQSGYQPDPGTCTTCRGES